ncbi:TrkH family potassium uptake protein [Litoreibacter albidus]|uniref:Trk system potassium uptake protein TrkH n=1 Tax=Litoreibacter albidus TaxID=670155 RepID=A0A1H2T790_9RHOB|nr:potassium transporter TrkG [Litoreibacter albidus]SDW39751.1 trk system potassium uptake protein TrkH [Litoreibacter albidus]
MGRGVTVTTLPVLLRLPLLVQLMATGSVAMLLPAIHAFALNQHRVAQPFFYGAVLFSVLAALVALATFRQPIRNVARSQLLTLVAAYLVLPVMLAVPLHEARPSMSFFNAYFEMVSSITTTGASIFDTPRLVPDPIHLWRGLVGWFGGLLVIVSAVAVLAPMTLGGFEVLRPTASTGGLPGSGAQLARATEPNQRVARYTSKIVPIYVSLTLIIWLLQIITGAGSFNGLMIAMATMSTSGILPLRTMVDMGISVPGEVIVFAFLFIAVTRQVVWLPFDKHYFATLRLDPEMRVALCFLLAVPLALWLRHFIGAIEINEESDALAAVRALWGALFTVLSFLTTTGFVSSDWETARDWSALPTPGLVLAGMAIMGGGVATTAGGVKLLRFYALYKHGVREMERLVHPSSIGSGGRLGRGMRREGAFIAWIFFMLFALSISGVVVTLALSGLRFDESVVLALAALSTTGPLVHVALDGGLAYANLTVEAKAVLIGAMVLGRMETLAIIALFNPDFWRR